MIQLGCATVEPKGIKEAQRVGVRITWYQTVPTIMHIQLHVHVVATHDATAGTVIDHSEVHVLVQNLA